MTGPQYRHALEVSDDAGSMRVRRRSSKHEIHRPTEVATVAPGQLMLAAWAIANRVGALDRRHGEASHVFVCPALKVFVLLESRPVARVWLREHFDWYLGLYRRRTQYTEKGMAITLDLTPEGIEEDLRYHLADLEARA